VLRRNADETWRFAVHDGVARQTDLRPMSKRHATLRATARDQFREERGVALALTLLITASLAITTMAIAALMVSNERSSGRDRDTVRALNAAESGIASALSVLSQQDASGAQTVGSTLSTTSFTVDGASGMYSAVKTGALEWTVGASGTSPGGDVTRQLEVRVAATTQTTGAAASPVYGWGFFMASTTPDCVTVSGQGNNIGNSALLTVPTYTAGSLCLSGGGSPLIAEPSTSAGGTIPLYVGGKFRTSGNSSPVGTSAKRIASATVVGGCQISFHGWRDVICSQQGVPTSGTGSGIWANSYSSTPMTGLTKPTIDAANWYTNAKPGPNAPCGAGSTVGPLSFDNNGARDTSLGNRRLLYLTGSWGAGNNFDCLYYDGGGNLVGRLAWTFGQPGTLIAQGTIFIDGNLTVGGTDQAVYSGNATIYVNGTVTMSNGARICGAPLVSGKCSGNWNPQTNSLMLVAANAGNAATAFSMAGDSQFEGIAYASGKYVAGNSAFVAGPVIADTGTLSGHTMFKTIIDPPPGAPGDGAVATTTTWKVVPGSWRQLG
jgi:Tfp pilus assembly protein PilX